MKKISLFVPVLCLVMGVTACKGGQKEKTVEDVDYAALVEKELPPMDDFIKTVDIFQQGTKQLLPTGKVWDDAEKSIREMLEPKGFAVVRDADRNFFIFASKNCKFVVKDENYVFSYSVDSVKTDGPAAAYFFEPMGDMYDKGEILLADTGVYDALLEQIKALGYELTENDFAEAEDEEQYVNDCYYFKCSREQKRITLHYDFMKAQGTF